MAKYYTKLVSYLHMWTLNTKVILPKIEVVKDRKRKKLHYPIQLQLCTRASHYHWENIHFLLLFIQLFSLGKVHEKKNYVAFSRRLVTYSGTT